MKIWDRRILHRGAWRRHISTLEESKCKTLLVKLERILKRMNQQERPARRLELMICDLKLRIDYLSIYTVQNIYKRAGEEGIDGAA